MATVGLIILVVHIKVGSAVVRSAGSNELVMLPKRGLCEKGCSEQ
jgi:hypothetical protein